MTIKKLLLVFIYKSRNICFAFTNKNVIKDFQAYLFFKKWRFFVLLLEDQPFEFFLSISISFEIRNCHSMSSLVRLWIWSIHLRRLLFGVSFCLLVFVFKKNSGWKWTRARVRVRAQSSFLFHDDRDPRKPNIEMHRKTFLNTSKKCI
jgi:hypothetical protein